MKRYLVTGGAGFIGSHIVQRLLEQGHAVWIVDNFLTGYKTQVPSEATVLELDLSKPESFDQLPDLRFDAVLHLAAQSSGQISHEKPQYDLMTNTLGTLLLLKWCAQRGINRLLYASSMSVYGNVEPFPVVEKTHGQPCSFYGITKLASEHYIDYFRAQGMHTTILRMFNVYGPGQNLSNLKQGMVSIYLAYILKKEPVLVKGSKDRV